MDYHDDLPCLGDKCPLCEAEAAKKLPFWDRLVRHLRMLMSGIRQ